MDAVRSLVRSAMVGLILGILLLLAGLLIPSAGPWVPENWGPAHGVLLMAGALLPGFTALHAHTLQHLGGQTLPAAPLRMGGVAMVVGATLWAIGHIVQPSGLFAILAFLGLAVTAYGAVRVALPILGSVPKNTVDPDEPLTKGDDASWKHIRLAHIFLLFGAVLLLIAYAPGATALSWLAGTRPAGLHALWIGYGLLSVYGLGHLWIPRFSGVPAIAAGAIKGELHTTLLGIVGILLGFLTGIRGFLVGLGPFVFLGFFTYMGVLGANIMKRKSQTHRVTPEFVYVPWTFAGVFWLISGVLMGVTLTAVPDVLGDKVGALRWIHIHVNLFGGMLQLLMGWATRAHGRTPPLFTGAMKGGFYLLNLALVVAAGGRLAGGTTHPAVVVGAGLAVLAFALYARAMRAFMRPVSSQADA